ncbi:MAG: virulence protein RhuM/Fic/DOC family protein, partial [Aquaticitalea sp.]
SVVRHIKNIYKSSELNKKATCAKIAQVQREGEREVNRNIQIYNLDLIISVGYRVNSKKGTQFRIWANKIIKDHLVKGYSINEERLQQLKKTIQLNIRTSKSIETNGNSDGFLDLLNNYSKALDILDDYDHQNLQKHIVSKEILFYIDYDEAISAIFQLREKFGASSLFGNEKDQSFRNSIAVIDQTFDKIDLYPSIEEKAANLLYLVVKNHSFTDGNKRIGA